MSSVLGVLVLLTVLTLFAVLALWCGVDSRDGRGGAPVDRHRHPEHGSWW